MTVLLGVASLTAKPEVIGSVSNQHKYYVIDDDYYSIVFLGRETYPCLSQKTACVLDTKKSL